MLPIEKVLNQVFQLTLKETKAQQSENKSEIHIILAHEFSPFPSCERAHGFLVGRKNSCVFPNWIVIIVASAKSPKHTKPDCQLGLTSQKKKT